MRRGLLALLLLAPGALAHGQSIEVPQDAGAYHVVFYTYDQITAFEQVRVAWNVTDRATQQRVEVPNATLVKEDYNVTGALVNRTESSLQQRAAGFVFADVTMGPEGRAHFTVTLPPGASPGAVSFDSCVYPGTTPPGGLEPRDPKDGCAPHARTPLPAPLALLALGASALALRRR